MMRTTRKWLAVGLGVVIVLVAAELTVRLSADWLPGTSDWPTPEAELKYHQLTQEGLDPDVVFLGSSFVEAAIDPGQFTSGVDGYNLGMPFTNMETMASWLEAVVFTETDPDVIVIGREVWRDPNPPDVDFIGAMQVALARDRTRQDALLEMWARRGMLASYDRSLARDRLASSGLWTDRGHQTAYYDVRTPSDDWADFSTATFTPDEAALLRQLVGVATSHSSIVVILVEPVAAGTGVDRGSVQGFVTELRAFAEGLGAVVWEPPARFWDDDRFVDGVHFDREATSSFSAYVDEMLLALPDPRGG